MFVDIMNPSIMVYDGNNHFIGEAKFSLSPESKKALLRLVNDNEIPQTLVFLNANFHQATEHYNPPSGYVPVESYGILQADFLHGESRNLSPIEIQLLFDATARGKRAENPYYYDSVMYDNIQIMSISEMIG